VSPSLERDEATVKAGGHYIFANPLFLKPCSAAVFMPFLEKEFPHLAVAYHERYKDRAFLPKPYHQRIAQLMTRLRQKYGMITGKRPTERPPVPQPETQMRLF